MSQDVFATGKVWETHHKPQAIVNRLVKDKGLEEEWESHQEDFGEDAAKHFIEEYSDFLVVGDKVWKKVNVTTSDDSYFFHTHRTSDGFDFTTKFYDGGTCLNELLEGFIEKEFSEKC